VQKPGGTQQQSGADGRGAGGADELA